jgi:hypothetical protein
MKDTAAVVNSLKNFARSSGLDAFQQESAYGNVFGNLILETSKPCPFLSKREEFVFCLFLDGKTDSSCCICYLPTQEVSVALNAITTQWKANALHDRKIRNWKYLKEGVDYFVIQHWRKSWSRISGFLVTPKLLLNPVRDTNGVLIPGCSKIEARWRAHFLELSSAPFRDASKDVPERRHF